MGSNVLAGTASATSATSATNNIVAATVVVATAWTVGSGLFQYGDVLFVYWSLPWFLFFVAIILVDACFTFSAQMYLFKTFEMLKRSTFP